MKTTPMEKWILSKIGYKDNNPRSALDEYTVERLKYTLDYVKNNTSYYKEKLKHIEVQSIKSLEDIKKLPFTTGAEIVEKNSGFVAVSQKNIKRIVTLNTSGTTGKAKRIYFTENDLKSTIDFFSVGMSVLVNEKSRVMIFMPGNTYGSVGDLLLKSLNNIGVKAYIYGPIFDNNKAAAEIIEKNINTIVGIPVQVHSLCKTYPNLKIEKILLSTDYVPKVLVEELEMIWHCTVFNHYGMTEMGFGGGVQCEALHGYHMREGDMYFEIINPYTGKEALNNEWGEIVFTTLNREAMPLIRYRTGDISRKLSYKCGCNTILKSFDLVQGRINEGSCSFTYGELTLRELDEKLFSIPQILDFKIDVNREQNKDIIMIAIKTKESEQNIEENLKGHILRNLLHIEAIRKGIEEGCLEIKGINAWQQHSVSNGTFKRKIYDNRKVMEF